MSCLRHDVLPLSLLRNDVLPEAAHQAAHPVGTHVRGGPMTGMRVLGCAAVLAAFLAVFAAGCGRSKVAVCIRVNTQAASLCHLLHGGCRPCCGGLTMRMDLLMRQQQEMMARLDAATQAAQEARREADQIAEKREAIVTAAAKAATDAATEAAQASAEGDGSEEQVKNPSGG